MKAAVQNIKIYQSDRPGLGKTTQIKKYCESNNLTFDDCILSLSGNINPETLFNRLEAIFKKHQSNPAIKPAIIVQIYNICQSSIPIVNKLLSQLIIFSNYSYSRDILMFAVNSAKPKIIIELQNTMGFDPLKKLTILNHFKAFEANIIENIKDFSKIDNNLTP